MKYIIPIILFIFCHSYVVLAENNVCDKNLKKVDDPKVAYTKRGSRCEGYYKSEVSSSELAIVGFTYGRLHYQLDSNEVVDLSAPLATETVNVRAVGVKLKTYYRMDGVLPVGSVFKWPLKDVVEPQRLSDHEVGVYGWYMKEGRMIYVPINFGEIAPLTLALRSSLDIKNIQWRSSQSMQQECGQMTKWIPLKIGRVNRGKEFRVPIKNSPTGEICIEVAAKVNRSSKWLRFREIVRVPQG